MQTAACELSWTSYHGLRAPCLYIMITLRYEIKALNLFKWNNYIQLGISYIVILLKQILMKSVSVDSATKILNDFLQTCVLLLTKDT